MNERALDGPWTRFMDMHSGGGQKEGFAFLLIQAPGNEAVRIFYNRFGHSPHRVTCTCCGDDYSVDEHPTLADATAYDRGLRYAEDVRGWLYGKDRPADYREGRYLEPGDPVPDGMRSSDRFRWKDEVALDAFLANPQEHGYRIIWADEIAPTERNGDVPDQGYVWVE